MEKILCSHVSDLHSYFPTLSDKSRIVFNTGDWLPNLTRGDLSIEPKYQKNWLLSRIETIKEWLGDRVMYFCAGNHDFYPDIQELLTKHGIRFVDVTNRVFIDPETRLSMYGFPFIPWIEGEWNWERRGQDMANEFRIMRLKIADAGLNQVDILLAHCPPAGILDKNAHGEHIGNTVLINQMMYNDFAPRYLLVGHCHENTGILALSTPDTLISNAATTHHEILIEAP